LNENSPIIVGLIVRSTPKNYRKIEDSILSGSLAEILYCKRTFPHRLLRIIEVPKENKDEKESEKNGRNKFSYVSPSK